MTAGWTDSLGDTGTYCPHRLSWFTACPSGFPEILFHVLWFPGQYVTNTTLPWIRSVLSGQFQPRTTVYSRSTYRLTCKHRTMCLFHHNAHQGPLHPPRDSPYCVLESSDKIFVVDIGGHPDCISMDCLKPAHIDLDVPVDMALPPHCRRPPSARILPHSPPCSSATVPAVSASSAPPAYPGEPF